MPSWFHQFGQVAIAATVTLAVIVGVQQYNGGDSGAPQLADSQLPVLQTVPFTGQAEPVSLSRESLRQQPTEAQLMEQRKRINAILQDYELQLRLNAQSELHTTGQHQDIPAASQQ